MSKIHVLSEQVINKIAAGEVIERPASVVKELLENALDAKATRIIVEIENAGKDLIRVIDNGEGMDEQDARRCIARHATSKIVSENDLQAISTLGFRGEALASIAAVSQLTIITNQKERVEGFTLTVEGGAVTSSGIAAAESGTIIAVKNLFFNIPARKKFLKENAVELRHIIEVVTRYALIHPSITVRLLHNGYQLLHAPVVSDLKSNIASIYGLNLAKALLEVNYSAPGITIFGYVASPYQARNDKSQQAFFVNNRSIRSEDISQALYDAYHSLLFVGKHPVAVLNLAIDPQRIDVNVHPHKMEIKFEQKEQIYGAVYQAIRQTLERNQLLPTVSVDVQVPLPPTTSPQKYTFEPSKQTVLSTEATARPLPVVNNQQPLLIAGNEKFPEMKLLGQVHKTFFIAETQGGAFFIDQHAVHERVLYEQFMEQLMNSHVEVQNLLQGELLECTPHEMSLIHEQSNFLHTMGFTIQPFGDRTIQLTTVPSLLGRTQPTEALYEVLGVLQQQKKKTEEVQEEIITRMACRAAVMAGDTLTLGEMEQHLNELAGKKLPYTCPHGRPTMFKVTVDELEKKFRRK